MVLKSKPIALPKGPIRLHVWHTRGVLDGFLLGQWCEQWGRSWRMWMHPKVYVELGAALLGLLGAHKWQGVG